MLSRSDKEKLLECYDDTAPDDLLQLGKQIGVENLDKVLAVLGGGKCYIPTQEGFWGKLHRQVRDEEMKARFRGNNLTELCQDYQLGKRQVRRIVNG